MLPCLSLYALSQYYVNYENLQRSQLTNLLTKLVAVGLLVFVTLNKELLIVEPYLYLLDLPGKLSDSGEAVICALEILEFYSKNEHYCKRKITQYKGAPNKQIANISAIAQ